MKQPQPAKGLCAKTISILARHFNRSPERRMRASARPHALDIFFVASFRSQVKPLVRSMLQHHLHHECGHSAAGFKRMVPLEGLEPPLLSEADFESAASTIPPQGHFTHASQKSETLATKNIYAEICSWSGLSAEHELGLSRASRHFSSTRKAEVSFRPDFAKIGG